jgi:hypoxanthine-guanine phosphoribosyltransferase
VENDGEIGAILVSEAELHRRVGELGAEISRDYEGPSGTPASRSRTSS